MKRLVPLALVLSAVALGFIYFRDRAQDNLATHAGKDPTSEQSIEIPSVPLLRVRLRTRQFTPLREVVTWTR